MSSDSESETYVSPEIENLITQIGDMELNDNFINIKTNISNIKFVLLLYCQIAKIKLWSTQKQFSLMLIYQYTD